MSRRNFIPSPLPVAVALIVAACSSLSAAPAARAAGDPAPLRVDMRKLWEDHVSWTRMYIISVGAGLPDKDLTAQRLLQNQVDIGNAFKPFYGEEAGNKLTALLKEHILGAADLLAAAKAGDQAKTEKEKARWSRNADEIAVFLSNANPTSWPLATAKAEMKMHLDLTLKEATDRFAGHYAEDIKDYDRVHEHILHFADVLTTGVTAQFPDKVNKS
jgi:hypothetical protein